jgi:hypothetical protein
MVSVQEENNFFPFDQFPIDPHSTEEVIRFLFSKLRALDDYFQFYINDHEQKVYSAITEEYFIGNPYEALSWALQLLLRNS